MDIDMCGIFSSLGSYSVEEVKPHFDAIQHRGPDASNLEIIDNIQDKNLIFGFHRLSIIDPSEKSMQPLRLNNIFLICNGEIYNYKELIEQYGFTMRTLSDCEIILHLYEHFGRNETALQKLLNVIRAEFAFILYDGDNQTLMAARDAFGIRPLFYSYSGKELVFASEIKALLFRQTVKQLPPGSYVFREHSAKYNTTKFIKYYDVTATKISKENMSIIKSQFLCEPVAKSSCEILHTVHKNIRDLLKHSVIERLMSDRPVGCFLSGGLDSSLITALVSQHIAELHCFSIGLRDGLDIIASKKVVNFLKSKGNNIKHHIVYFTVDEGYRAIRDVIRCLETRCVTTIRAGVVNYLLAQYVSTTNVKVLYSGSGSDEVFNGYQYGKLIQDANTLERDSKRLLDNLHLYDNLRDDRTTANFGLEVRVPFLCRDLVDYVFSIHGDYRLSNIKMEKSLLREAFKSEGLLPDEILFRRKEAWSDAVSSEEVSWYKTLAERIDQVITDKEFTDATTTFPYDTPKTKESYYYRKIFEELFPGRASIIPKIWLPPRSLIGRDIIDPSATVLNCYER
jgi:asparagine synthase (glutamine-hydrolysing)